MKDKKIDLLKNQGNENQEPLISDKEGEQVAQAPEPLRPIKAIKLSLPGAKSAGPYTAGKVYKVGEGELTNEEAHRLISVKGFIEVEG